MQMDLTDIHFANSTKGRSTTQIVNENIYDIMSFFFCLFFSTLISVFYWIFSVWPLISSYGLWNEKNAAVIFINFI